MGIDPNLLLASGVERVRLKLPSGNIFCFSLLEFVAGKEFLSGSDCYLPDCASPMIDV